MEWLGRTPSPAGVVWEEYVHEPAEMAGLVRELYAMGSPRVFVPAAFIRPRCSLPHGEQPEESFGLGVHLPPSVEARWAMLDFFAERAGRAGQMPPSSARRYAESGGIVLLAYVSSPCAGRDLKSRRRSVRLDTEVFWRKDGTSFPVEYASAPMRDDGESVGAVVSFSNITARKRAEDDLKLATEAAEAANQAKSTFLANMSHELRTPLNAVILYSELLQEEAEDQGLDPDRPAVPAIHAGGRIDVASEAGTGTTFTVWLPAEVAPTPGESVAETSLPTTGGPEGGLAVLVIDDDPTARDLLSRVLVKEGYRVRTAADGRAGLDAAAAERPDLIVLDVMMPKMDGWAVLSALKADPTLDDVPVVMHTMVDDRNLGYALGASDYLTKPVDRDRLVSVLNKYRARSAAGPVLVVEDDDDTREAVHRALAHGGWQVAEANNGRVALQRLAEVKPAAATGWSRARSS